MSVIADAETGTEVLILESLEFVIPCWESVHGEVDYHGPAEEGASYWLRFTCLICESGDVVPACKTFWDTMEEVDGLVCPECGMVTPAMEGVEMVGKIGD